MAPQVQWGSCYFLSSHSVICWAHSLRVKPSPERREGVETDTLYVPVWALAGKGCWEVIGCDFPLPFCTLLEHDELREIFNDISSSSEDEDERDHHDDEDLNIMDTEEDLERQLQDKLNESDGQQQENEGSNQIGERVV